MTNRIPDLKILQGTRLRVVGVLLVR
jgi:hypothetical protein